MLRVIAFCGLAAVLAVAVDWRAVGRILAGADLALAGVALVAVQMQIALSALRWKLTANRLGLPLGYRRALVEYEISTAANQILPGGIIGDLARVWRNRVLDDGRWRKALRSVVFERAAGQVAFLGCAAVGVFAWSAEGAGVLIAPMALVTGLCGAAAAIAVVAGRRIAAFSDLKADVFRVYGKTYGWALHLALSAAIVMLYAAVFYAAALSLGVHLPMIALFTAIPLTLAAMLVPVAIAGFGPREAAAVLVFPALGILPAEAVAVSIAYGAINIVASLPGLPLLLLARRAAGAAPISVHGATTTDSRVQTTKEAARA